MNKKLILLGILLTMSLLLVNSASAAITDITFTGTPASVTGIPGNIVNVSYTALNAGPTAKALTFTSNALNFATPVTPTINGVTVPAGGNIPVTFTVTIPSATTTQGYTGVITATGGAETDNTVSYTVTVSKIVQIYNNVTPLEILGEEGQTSLTGTFTIQNTGNQVLNALTFDTSALDLSDSGNNLVTLSFSNPGSLNPGQNVVITATAAYASGLDLDTYGGIVSVKQSGVTVDSFKLDLKVIPEICESGIVSDGTLSSSSTADLQLTVRNPDSGDSFKAGDNIQVEVRVDNDGSQDLDVAVTAILYDLDQDDEIASFETSTQEIRDGNEETFEFDLEVPSSSDLDEDNRYVIFIKAYEDGSEDENCNFKSINLDFERERDDVIFDQIDVTPSIVKSGDTVNLRLDIKNEGTRDQNNVYAKIVNNELGLNLLSNEFDLDRAGDSNDDIVKTFTFTVPQSASSKDYLVEFTLYDESDDAFENGQEFVTLTVQGESTPGTGNTVNLNVKSNTPAVNAASGRANLNFIFTNNENRNLDAVVEIVTVGSWAQPVAPQTLSLHTGDNNLYFDLILSDGVERGPHSATVIVRPAGNSDFDSQSYSFNFDVQGTEGSSIFNGSIPTLFWIIGDVVLVLTAIFIVKALFFGRKHP